MTDPHLCPRCQRPVDAPGPVDCPTCSPSRPFGFTRVAECSPDRLVLASRNGRIIARVFRGMVAVLGGALLLLVTELQLSPDWKAGPKFPPLVAAFAVFLLGYGAFQTVLLAKLGRRLTFDGTTRSVRVRRLFVWTRSWTADQTGGLVYYVRKCLWTKVRTGIRGGGVVHLINSFEGKSSKPTDADQVCELFLIDPEGRVLARVETEVVANETTEPLDAARALTFAARVLGVPAVVVPEAPPATDMVRAAVEWVGTLWGPVPFHEPRWTVTGVGLALGIGLAFAAAVQYLVVYAGAAAS